MEAAGGKSTKSNGNSATKHGKPAQFKPSVVQMAERAKQNGDSSSTHNEPIQKNVLGEPSFNQPNSTVQARLKMGSTGDKFEKEADSVADRVVSNNNRTSVNKAPAPPVQTSKIQPGDLQKKESPEEEVQAKEKDSNEDKIQRKTSATDSSTDGIESNLASSKGGGSKMDDNTKSTMESGIGADFSGVHVHYR